MTKWLPINAVKLMTQRELNDRFGTVRVASFFTGGRDEAVKAEEAGFVRNLLELCKSEEI